jgi:oxygen-independent coproporphyrinogen III oxidase
MTHESQLARLGLFDARVPRYTSYPTAPHFTATAGAQHFTQWLRAISPGSSLSLYVHVPFCRRLCWFCACRTQGTTSDDPVNAYVQTLLAEITLLRRHLPAGVTLSRLHWGGGTPTILPPAQITRLAEALFAAAPLAPKAEFSVEIDPNEIDAPRLDALVAAGMNRASIGVQDFDPLIQEAIGRLQSPQRTVEVAQMIRDRGVPSLNADILYGLPHQTPARIAASVHQLLTLSPDRVALYGYAHVPWMSRRQQLIPSDAMPSPTERLALFETAARIFQENGYQALGIDHFAKPQDGLAIAQSGGRLRRNFQGYTDDTAPVLIGLGASSISRFPQGYAQNAAGTADYTKSIRAGHFAAQKGHVFSDDDRLRARMIEALMCDFHLSRRDILANHAISADHLDHLLTACDAAFDGLLHLDDAGLTIPAKARPLTRMIARFFDTYDQSRAQHSVAV